MNQYTYDLIKGSNQSIAQLVAACQKQFEAVQSIQSSSAETAVVKDTISIENAARFRLWAANIGAFHPQLDAKSADHRLRDAPVIIRAITDILRELSEVLGDIGSILAGKRSSETANLQISIDLGDESASDTSELEELILSVPELLTDLFKLSILIRKATTTDKYAKAEAAKYGRLSPQFDISHVIEKFPKTETSPGLSKKLGIAITKRRQYLRYARDHHRKISHQPVASLSSTQREKMRLDQVPAILTAPRPSEPTNTARTTLQLTHASTLAQPALPPAPAYNLDDEFDDTKTRTTLVTDSWATDNRYNALKVVPLETLRRGGNEFECPYCHGMVQTWRQSAWEKHVLQDLRAYVCTFEDCTVGLFRDRNSWFQHELECHRRQWICAGCPNRIFHSSTDLQAHMTRRHRGGGMKAKDLRSAVNASSRPVTAIAVSACPLCAEWEEKVRNEVISQGNEPVSGSVVMVPLQRFARHLGRHQEQLALFAIAPSFDMGLSGDDSSYGSAPAAEDRLNAVSHWQGGIDSQCSTASHADTTKSVDDDWGDSPGSEFQKASNDTGISDGISMKISSENMPEDKSPAQITADEGSDVESDSDLKLIGYPLERVYANDAPAYARASSPTEWSDENEGVNETESDGHPDERWSVSDTEARSPSSKSAERPHGSSFWNRLRDSGGANKRA